MTSHVSWSIGFEVSLADSFADHFLKHVNFWAMMCTFYSKGRSCKNLQTPSETFKNACKNDQMPIPNSRSHCVKFYFSPFFSNMPQKMEKNGASPMIQGGPGLHQVYTRSTWQPCNSKALFVHGGRSSNLKSSVGMAPYENFWWPQNTSKTTAKRDIDPINDPYVLVISPSLHLLTKLLTNLLTF